MESAKTQTSRFAAALSTAEDTDAAIAEVCGTTMKQLGTAPDLALLFASVHHARQLEEAAAQVCEHLGTDALLGCSGESIIGGAREIEQAPAISLWLASMPATNVIPMHLDFQQTREGGSFAGWPAHLPDPWPEGAAMLMLGEPYSFPADELVRRLNEDHAGVPVLGGMASGGASPGENRLILGRQVYDAGAVAVLIYGAVRIRSVVSQGCRPIGQPFVVTRAEANMIQELGGAPPLKRLQEMYESLSTQEQQMVRSGVHVGRVLSEYRDKFDRGDFLVRNVIGADPSTGAIAIGDFVRAGQTIQFHVRDEQTADEDLRALLQAQQSGPPNQSRGALLFTCNGRGTRLFSCADHDAGCVRDELGEIPTAGFFAQGEIGPVGGQNFLHGFTASVALFDGDA